MEKDFEENIWDLLSLNEQKTATEIAGILNRSYYDVLRVLNNLEKENKIEKIQIKNYTYWRKKNVN